MEWRKKWANWPTIILIRNSIVTLLELFVYYLLPLCCSVCKLKKPMKNPILYHIMKVASAKKWLISDFVRRINKRDIQRKILLWPQIDTYEMDRSVTLYQRKWRPYEQSQPLSISIRIHFRRGGNERGLADPDRHCDLNNCDRVRSVQSENRKLFLSSATFGSFSAT